MAYGMKVKYDDENLVVTCIIIDRADDNAEVATKDYPLESVHESLRTKVALYGLGKLLQDRTSGDSVKELGADKLDLMQKVADRLESGEWAAERTSGSPVVSINVEALARVKQISVPQAQKALKAYSPEQKEAIFANEAIVAAAAEIKAERENAADVSLDDLA